MNLKFYENGFIARLLPNEFTDFKEGKKLLAKFPISSSQCISCELKIGENIRAELTDLSFKVEFTTQAVQELENNMKKGNKKNFEIIRFVDGLSIALEVDYFQAKNQEKIIRNESLNEG